MKNEETKGSQPKGVEEKFPARGEVEKAQLQRAHYARRISHLVPDRTTLKHMAVTLGLRSFLRYPGNIRVTVT